MLHLLYCLDQHIFWPFKHLRCEFKWIVVAEDAYITILCMIIHFMIKLTELIIQGCFELNEAETTQLLEGYGFKPE